MLYESILATNKSWSFASCFSSSYKAVGTSYSQVNEGSTVYWKTIANEPNEQKIWHSAITFAWQGSWCHRGFGDFFCFFVILSYNYVKISPSSLLPSHMDYLLHPTRLSHPMSRPPPTHHPHRLMRVWVVCGLGTISHYATTGSIWGMVRFTGSHSPCWTPVDWRRVWPSEPKTLLRR